jgi:hypothetical protein
MKVLLNLTIAVFLSGCNPFGDFKPDSPDIVKKMWAKTPPKEPPRSLYCYKTLGDSTCYGQPLIGQEERLHGSYANLPESIPEDKTWLEEIRESFKKDTKLEDVYGHDE